jgi:hypothetical protein
VLDNIAIIVQTSAPPCARLLSEIATMTDVNAHKLTAAVPPDHPAGETFAIPLNDVGQFASDAWPVNATTPETPSGPAKTVIYHTPPTSANCTWIPAS